MSWVLILTPLDNHYPRHPAIIGGYRTKEEAVAAGEAAVERDEYGFPA